MGEYPPEMISQALDYIEIIRRQLNGNVKVGEWADGTHFIRIRWEVPGDVQNCMGTGVDQGSAAVVLADGLLKKVLKMYPHGTD